MVNCRDMPLAVGNGRIRLCFLQPGVGWNIAVLQSICVDNFGVFSIHNFHA